MSTAPVPGSFPVADLLPKKETNAFSFLQKYPKYDGRGTVIAIIDSGVDPGAPGLQVTSDGKPKIIHHFNCAGTGDVNTSTVVKAENGTITGLSGRTLKIPASWSNPSGEYHIGLKQAFHILPTSLRKRVEAEWKEKNFDPPHRIATAKAHGLLNSFREKKEKKEKKDKKEKDDDTSPENKLIEAELQAAQDVLSTVSKDYHDLGPSWDCVVFHDGKSWQAAIDISENGDLEKTTLLAPYSESLKYATIEEYWLNYTVNIFDSGNLLQIVTPGSSHGTHVAAIAAANFPDDPSRNGLAPGAQIVNICISDHALGTMETLNSFTRAVVQIAKLGCVDVINLSYGEAARMRSSPIMSLLDELVKKHNILFCHAAGNEGVGLSTVGAPSSHSIINVGAYLTTAMMPAAYSMIKSYEGTPYNFTSRGPVNQGALGVSICAPGGAVASVPNYELSSYQLMNGTSMASPNAAGCFSLIVSAVKQEGIRYSTYSIRRAVENTAFKPSHYEPFAMGHGLIQVDKAFENLRSHQNLVEVDVDFRTVPENLQLGVYRRVAESDARDELIPLTIKPTFLDEKEHRSLQENNFSFNLLIQSDKEWVECSSYAQLSHSARKLELRLHPSSLPVGLHFALVKAYDSSNIEKGPLFHIPVTYVMAEDFLESKYYNKGENVLSYPAFTLKPGSIERILIQPPPGANMIHFTVKNLDKRPVDYRASLCQLVVDGPLLNDTFSFKLAEEEKKSYRSSLKNESVVELSISKSCLSSDGESSASAHISFSTVQVVSNGKAMHSGEGIYRFLVQSRQESILAAPKVSFTHALTYTRPTSSKISQLSERELISQGKQLYENILTYSFTLAGSTEVELYLTDFKKMLYESELYGQLLYLYDKKKCFLSQSDSFNHKPVKLDKGTYTVRAQLWHHSRDYLSKLEKIPLRIKQKLSERCELTLHGTRADAMARENKVSHGLFAKNVSIPLYAVPPSEDTLSKLQLTPGSVLDGNLTLRGGSPSRLFYSSSFRCTLDTVPPAKSSSGEKEKDKESSKIGKEDHLSLLLTLKLTFLDSLDEEGKAALLKEIDEVKCEPNQIASVNLCKIKAVEANESLKDKESNERIIALADEIIDSVNPLELLGSLELKKAQAQSGVLSNGEVKKVEKLKEQLVLAYLQKGVALADSLENTEEDTTEKKKVVEELEKIWLNLNNLFKGQFASSNDLKQNSDFLHAFYDLRGDSASHMKLRLRMQKELEYTKDNEKEIIELAGKREEWAHLKKLYERCFHAKFPKDFYSV